MELLCLLLLSETAKTHLLKICKIFAVRFGENKYVHQPMTALMGNFLTQSFISTIRIGTQSVSPITIALESA